MIAAGSESGVPAMIATQHSRLREAARYIVRSTKHQRCNVLQATRFFRARSQVSIFRPVVRLFTIAPLKFSPAQGYRRPRRTCGRRWKRLARDSPRIGSLAIW